MDLMVIIMILVPILAIAGFIGINIVIGTEFGRKILGKKYLKMYLVRESSIIKTYIRPFTDDQWLLDKKLKKAWKIPIESKLIRQKTAYIFYGSLDSIESFTYEEVSEFYNKPKGKNEWSIPFLRLTHKEEGRLHWNFEKSKLIIRQSKEPESENTKEYQIIDEVNKSYTPVLPSLDIASTFMFLTGAAIDLVMESPKKKDDMKWLLYIAMAIGGIVLMYYIFNKR